MYNLEVRPITLRELAEYRFRYDLNIQIGHLDYTGRLGHDAIVRIVHEARVHFFHFLGVAENDFGDGRTGIIMGDLVITGTGEASLFDRVRVDTHAGEISRSSFRLFHRLAKEDGVIALVETGLMTFDYVKRLIVPIPDFFRKRLQQLNEQDAGSTTKSPHVS